MAKTLHDEYSEALAAARARQEAQAIERSARVALRACGWAADREQLEAWADKLSPARRAAVVEQALRMQAEQAGPERRYTREEREAYMAMTTLPKETRDAIREFVRKRRTQEPSVRASELLTDVNRQFKTQIRMDNFYVSYFGGKASRFRAESERQPGRAAGPLPTGGVATAPAVAPAVASPNGGTPTPPSAPGGSSVVDPLKLGPIHVITVGRGQLRVLIDYTGPTPTVFALVAAAAAVLAEREVA
jgi:hypothetical protein